MNRFGSALQTKWDWRAAGNFVFGGAGSGLLLTAAVAGSAAAALAAIALIVAGLCLVWLELGRPWRALNVFAHPQTSWMTRESMMALVAVALGAAGAVLHDSRLLAGAGAAALGFLYCQARILHAAKGIPAWREPALVPLILATGMAEGGSLYLVLAPILGSRPAWLVYALVVLLAFRALGWHRYCSAIAASGAPEQALQAWRGPKAAFLGSLLPAVLLLVAIAIPAQATVLTVVAGCIAILAGWLFKFRLIIRDAYVQGYAIGKLRRGHPKADHRAAQG